MQKSQNGFFIKHRIRYDI